MYLHNYIDNCTQNTVASYVLRDGNYMFCFFLRISEAPKIAHWSEQSK